MNKKLVYTIVLLAVVTLITLPFVGRSLSILAVSQIYIDPQVGYEDPDSGEWAGSYWVILSSTSTYGNHVWYTFDASETEKYSDTVDGEKLVPKSSLIIRVNVGKPYVYRPLTQTPYLVCKDMYGYAYTPGSSNKYWAEHYEFNSFTGQWEKKAGYLSQQSIILKETASDWKIVVPLWITAYKSTDQGNIMLESNGQTVVQLNVSGSDALIPLSFENPQDPTEQLQFKLEGLLGSGYIVTLPDMAILRDDLVFEKTGNLLSYIKYDKTNPNAYVNYWYGNYATSWQEHEDGLSGFVYLEEPSGVFRETIGVTNYWYPATMFIYSDPPATSSDGLVSYLENRARRLESWEIDRWGEGYEILNNEIRVYMPYNSWNWLYTLKVSTELMDTYVWQPTYADGEIVSVKWSSSGLDTATISNEDSLEVKVKNVGSVDGNLRLRFNISPFDAPLLIDSVGRFFGVNEEYTFVVKAKNLGSEAKTDGQLNIELVNDGGSVRDSAIAKFTLLPITGVTLLNVKTVESGSNKLLSGISVTAQYGTNSLLKVSSSGWVTFDLGAYQGSVKITAEETINYYGATLDTYVSTGSNVEVLSLMPKEFVPEDYDWTLILILIVAVSFGLTGFTLFSKRRKKT